MKACNVCFMYFKELTWALAIWGRKTSRNIVGTMETSAYVAYQHTWKQEIIWLWAYNEAEKVLYYK